jgi:hypothetical protein
VRFRRIPVILREDMRTVPEKDLNPMTNSPEIFQRVKKAKEILSMGKINELQELLKYA